MEKNECPQNGAETWEWEVLTIGRQPCLMRNILAQIPCLLLCHFALRNVVRHTSHEDRFAGVVEFGAPTGCDRPVELAAETGLVASSSGTGI